MTHMELAALRIPQSSCTLSKRPAAFPSGSPHFARRGFGPYLVDERGYHYLDWMGSLGATPLGYSHPRVMAAVKAQLDRGTVFSLPSVLEAQVADKLCAVIPCAEQIHFFKTGSESCSAAVSIARAATGRDRILVDARDYHGWHDTFRVTAPDHPGVPSALGRLISSWPNLVDVPPSTWKTGIAAVILEPARLHEHTTQELQAIVDTAHAHGALVIFDEMILGGRIALAGGQEYFGVVPDLATFGKAFGAGLPLAFVAGSAELMAHSWACSGTFSGDALALAACEAMLEVYRSEEVIATLQRSGAQLRKTIDEHPYPVRTVGFDAHFALRFAGDQRIEASRFVQQCAKQYVLFHPALVNASAAMSKADVTRTCEVVAAALDAMAAGVPLEGEPAADGIRALLARSA